MESLKKGVTRDPERSLLPCGCLSRRRPAGLSLSQGLLLPVRPVRAGPLGSVPLRLRRRGGRGGMKESTGIPSRTTLSKHLPSA